MESLDKVSNKSEKPCSRVKHIWSALQMAPKFYLIKPQMLSSNQFFAEYSLKKSIHAHDFAIGTTAGKQEVATVV
jgi:hypothetical protein